MIMKPLNGRELREIEFMLALDARVAEGGDCLKTRLKGIKNGWRDYRLMAVLTRKVLAGIYDTLPNKTLQHLDKMRKDGEALIRFKPASRAPEWAVIRDDELKTLINLAMASECALCMKEGKQIDRCRLRRTLMDICPPTDDTDIGCGFREAAAQLDYVEYVK